VRDIDWSGVLPTGLTIGVLNGVLTGCTSPVCIGFLLAPAFGFVAGWSIARASARAVKRGQTATAIPGAVVGGIVGFMGWLGQVIGYPIWLNSLDTAQSGTGFLACVTLGAYIPMATALGALGWWVGSKRS
jgi:hypothetical protein